MVTFFGYGAPESEQRLFGSLYGTATLREHLQHDLAALARPTGCDATPLGQHLAWVLPNRQGHSITFGSTRSGKGVTSIIPALLSYAGSMVVIDPKGENAWVTAPRRRQMGHRVVILDPWGEVNRRYGSKASPPVVEQTSKFNPLSFIDPASEDFADDVGAIADALVIPGSMESHWTDSARELISGLVAAQVQLEPGSAHLGQVRRSITSDETELVGLVNRIVQQDPDSLAARKLRRFAKSQVTPEIASIRSTAETQTATLDSARLQTSLMTEQPVFNLEELARGRVTLYLVLPLDRLQSHGRWLRLILTMAIRAIARQDIAPSLPVLFMLDEMGTVGSLRMIEQAYGLMSGVGIRVSAYLQDLKQLMRDYPESWETFLANASVIQALGVADKTTSDYLSDLVGQQTVRRWNRDTSKEHVPDAMFPRPVLFPQEIRDFTPDRVLTIMPGIGTFAPLRLPYFAPDSIWRGMYRSPPWFAAANAAPPQPPATETRSAPPNQSPMISPEVMAKASELTSKAAERLSGWLNKGKT